MLLYISSGFLELVMPTNFCLIFFFWRDGSILLPWLRASIYPFDWHILNFTWVEAEQLGIVNWKTGLEMAAGIHPRVALKSENQSFLEVIVVSKRARWLLRCLIGAVYHLSD